MKLRNIVAAVAVSAAALTTSAFAEGRYVIVLKNNTSADSIAADVAAAGGTIVRTLPQVGIAIATRREFETRKRRHSAHRSSTTGQSLWLCIRRRATVMH